MRLRALILLWLAIAALGTASRARDWADEARLWRSALRLSPTAPRPLVNLAGVAADRDGDLALASYYYARALDHLETRPRREREEVQLLVRVNTILLRARYGDEPGAREDFEAFMRDYPDFRNQYVVSGMLRWRPK